MSRSVFQKASECWPGGSWPRDRKPHSQVFASVFLALVLHPDLGLCVSEWHRLPVPAPFTF